MSYYISEPYKSIKFGSLLWSKNNFEVYGIKDRFSIFLNDYYLGELVNGYQTLKKKYNNDFECWINFLKNKDTNKIIHTKELIKETLNKCDLIENLWKNA